MIYHLCHLYFWKVVKMDKMKNHPTRVSTNQSPPLYVEKPRNSNILNILSTLNFARKTYAKSILVPKLWRAAGRGQDIWPGFGWGLLA